MNFALESLDASALAEKIANGELTCADLTNQVLDNIRQKNPQINAVCSYDEELAGRLAEQGDKTLASLSAADRARLFERQPFFGVPSLLKDLATADPNLPSTMGSAYFGKVSFAADGDLVARYKQAGFHLIGRSTSAELGLSPTTESPSYGEPTRNPWSLNHSAGGSSGGAGAAVAAGMVPIAHGGDGGGSIRIPASCCGLVGLKTSRGMTPFGPARGESWGGMVSEHMLTVSVRDCARTLDIAAGASPGAPYPAPHFDRAFADIAASAQRGERTRQLRIGLMIPETSPELDDEVRRGYALFGRQLQELGHQVVPVAMPFSPQELLSHVVPIIAMNAWAAIDAHARAKGPQANPELLQRTVQSMVQYAQSMTAAQYIGHVNGIHALGRRFADFMRTQLIDSLALPTLAQIPARIGRFAMDWDDYEHYRFGEDSLLAYSPFCPIANATGCPAVSLPVTRSEQGLPIGMQLVAPLGRDDLLIEIAAAYEREYPWDRYSPLAS